MKTYFEPEIEICDFAVEDILNASIGSGIEDSEVTL
jgi:hypothetical protein